MPFVYFGRRHTFYGKTLWEIVGHLKNYGVGRLVMRQKYKRYTEPCFMKILVAEPEMDDENSKGKLIVEKIFRGHRYGELDISYVAYKPDYLLIPKYEEYKYWKALENYEEKNITVFAPTADMPPLLKLVAETKGHHATEFQFSFKPNSIYPRGRIAAKGESYDVKIKHSLGTPLCPKLYEGVIFNKPSTDSAQDR